MVKEKEKIEAKSEDVTNTPRNLILLNDDVNTFDHVIESLIEICNFNIEQAEQCALITHLKGRCPILKGNTDELLKFKQQLSERFLSSVIN
jgi:ATP-dependent Clp protease adaptor protein ClpS